MRKNYFILFTFLTLLTSCGTGSRLSSSEIDLIGTTWQYQDDKHDWRYEITFLKNGELIANHPNDFTPDNDKWSQSGKKMEISVNNGYVVHCGKRVSINKIEGQAKNVLGIKWNWELTKK